MGARGCAPVYWTEGHTHILRCVRGAAALVIVVVIPLFILDGTTPHGQLTNSGIPGVYQYNIAAILFAVGAGSFRLFPLFGGTEYSFRAWTAFVAVLGVTADLY
jgi:hypothetical protein